MSVISDRKHDGYVFVLGKEKLDIEPPVFASQAAAYAWLAKNSIKGSHVLKRTKIYGDENFFEDCLS